MKRLTCMLAALAVVSGHAMTFAAATPPAKTPDPKEMAQVTEALPKTAPTKAQKPRKLLIFSHTNGFRHGSIPLGAWAIGQMGEKTGAFTAVASEDTQIFEADKLAAFDGILLLSTTGNFLQPNKEEAAAMTPEQRTAAGEKAKILEANLIDFVRKGKGVAGIHAATDAYGSWPEYDAMIGGHFDGHPWHCLVTVRVDEIDHPLTKCFEAPKFEVTDEIYQLKGAYSRSHQRVLLSLEPTLVPVTKKPEMVHRTDKDFGVSWIRKEGAGRVFYCSLGHRNEIFWNTKVMAHYLAGLQFVFGDLEAPADPKP